ncbi:uncharacterized protein E0L32_000826 [Thyridium curvatum]|uniref:Peptidase M20 dimerisation domain-containing protein n=1 Tax=Thyridium curvatum TaxID=1093900 RepID=A0A507B5M1_9PEZI|nr:uncharacterized protein E0L32_000826 [Thyridium curvatum]TPX12649.1 hypothetical protein E0L32_000826 [Thyridium curvatum]
MVSLKQTVSTSLLLAELASGYSTGWSQYLLGLDNLPGFRTFSHGTLTAHRKCPQLRPLDPSDDGLLSSDDIFSGKDALEKLVENHRPLVEIDSICYDDLGDFDTDERWKPFNNISKVLEDHYPNLYENAKVELVNTYGLVYTIQGSDENLAPILLTAHQDVVPVEEETLDQWDYPPFSAHYDSESGYLYGRGASDDKSGITALMSAMEALLEQEDYEPRRTVVLAFGFDEECGGARGAGEIAKVLGDRYGEGGIAVILDEGGAGLQTLGDTVYALPAVYEKGYLDVWFDLDVVGGHSSTPTPHTAIGMMSEVVVALEAHPFEPEIAKGGPVHEALVCLAEHSPDAFPELTRYVRRGDLKGAAAALAAVSRDTQYFIQTSQAATVVAGGQKINALPEFVTLGVNHRYAPQDSVGSIQHRIAHLVGRVAEKYDLEVRAFEGDEDYDEYLAAHGLAPVAAAAAAAKKKKKDAQHGLWEPVYNGTLNIEVRRKSYVTPQSPTKGAVWDVFAGTVRHSFADLARHVVVAPGAMTGNTDTRHYLDLSKNIYRWSPGSLKSFSNIHTFNERLLMSEHVNMAKFYYDFIRNFDQADL